MAHRSLLVSSAFSVDLAACKASMSLATYISIKQRCLTDVSELQEEMGLIWSNYWLWKGWAASLYKRHPERMPGPHEHRDPASLKLPNQSSNDAPAKLAKL